MISLEIIEYTPKLAEKWDRFVPKTNNGTLFHTQNFLNYHPEGRFENHHLIFAEGNRWMGILPAAAANRGGERIFASHPGASFGGIATSLKSGIRRADKMVELWIEWAMEHGFAGVEFTRVPVVYHKYPEEHADFCLMRRGGDIVRRELTAVLRLEDTIEETTAAFRPEARTAARKAEKSGVEVTSEGNIPAFHEILAANLGARHGVDPTHTLEELLDLKSRFPERIHQFNAVRKGEPVAGVSLWEVNRQAVIAFYISHKQSAQRYRPLNLLFREIFRWCIERGYRWFDFGTYTLDMEPNFGLARFKESFGARGIFRDTLRLTF